MKMNKTRDMNQDRDLSLGRHLATGRVSGGFFLLGSCTLTTSSGLLRSSLLRSSLGSLLRSGLLSCRLRLRLVLLSLCLLLRLCLLLLLGLCFLLLGLHHGLLRWMVRHAWMLHRHRARRRLAGDARMCRARGHARGNITAASCRRLRRLHIARSGRIVCVARMTRVRVTRLSGSWSTVHLLLLRRHLTLVLHLLRRNLTSRGSLRHAPPSSHLLWWHPSPCNWPWRHLAWRSCSWRNLPWSSGSCGASCRHLLASSAGRHTLPHLSSMRHPLLRTHTWMATTGLAGMLAHL